MRCGRLSGTGWRISFCQSLASSSPRERQTPISASIGCGRTLTIDATKFYSDFWRSYSDYARPYFVSEAHDTFRSNAQKRFERTIDVYTRDSNGALGGSFRESATTAIPTLSGGAAFPGSAVSPPGGTGIWKPNSAGIHDTATRPWYYRLRHPSAHLCKLSWTRPSPGTDTDRW